MQVRDVTADDFEVVAGIHKASGLAGGIPALDSPLCIVKKAVTDASGKIIGFGLLRISAEAIMTLEPSLTPQEKMEVMQALQPPVLAEAYAMGLDDITAVVHAETEKRFSKRLKQFGWTPDRDGFRSWNRRTI
jgi:hypothetical protein